MPAGLDREIAGTGETQIGLVDEYRRADRRARPQVAQLGVGERVELVVDRPKGPVEGPRVAVTGSLEPGGQRSEDIALIEDRTAAAGLQERRPAARARRNSQTAKQPSSDRACEIPRTASWVGHSQRSERGAHDCRHPRIPSHCLPQLSLASAPTARFPVLRALALPLELADSGEPIEQTVHHTVHRVESNRVREHLRGFWM